MIKAVIIDDEVNGRELLQEMLSNYIEGVQVVGTAKDVASGIQVIQAKQPDLVFLDIEMPGGDGFKIIDGLDEVNFKVIFITGFVEYAIKAIKYSALDYILKPVDLEELKLAIEKVTSNNFNISKNLALLRSYNNAPVKAALTVVISGIKKQHFISSTKISTIVVSEGNTVVQLKDGTRIITLVTLKHFEDVLSDADFMRVHKSALINLKDVKQVDHGRTGSVYLNSGMSVPFSSRKKAALMARLKEIS